MPKKDKSDDDRDKSAKKDKPDKGEISDQLQTRNASGVTFSDPVQTDLYIFSDSSNWQRPKKGPMVTPMFDIAKASGQKELYLEGKWLEYFKNTNTEVGYGRIIAADYGPSKGINEKGKLIFNTLVYPGRNIVRVLRVVSGKKDEGDWALVDCLDENTIPGADINVNDTPHYIHTVYGSTKKGALDLGEDAPIVPLIGSGGRWIQMEWLEKIELPKAVIISADGGVPICSTPGDLSTKLADNLPKGQQTVVGELRIAKGGIWGRTETGWIALRYNGANQTDWNI